MREIKFRGKTLIGIDELEEIGICHDIGWVEGSLLYNNGDPYIVGDVVESTEEYINHEFWIRVDPKSVGQYTNMTGIGGNHLFEKDLLKDDENFIWEIKYKQGSFVGHCDDLMAEQPLNTINLYARKIGNTYDDKRLLEGTS